MRCVAFVLAVFVSVAAAAEFALVASGETHAMLHPCDCPDAPGGGLAERATALAKLRAQTPVLLVDAGGFCGGSIYDTYTEGRARDSLRSAATVRAMGAMHYDAVVVGDDDLQFGAAWLADQAERSGLPLLCANCRTTSGAELFDTWRVVKRSGVRVGITAVTTPEKLFDRDTTVVVSDPLVSLRNIWTDFREASDVRIVLAHVGQRVARLLLDSLADAAVVVTGHRKQDPGPLLRVGDRALMQFGFQGKQLAVCRVEARGDRTILGDARWLDIGPHHAPDEQVTQLVALPDSASGAAPYGLYVMSQCPYGLPALVDFAAFAQRFPSTRFRVWFVGTELEDGSLESLHGGDEILEEMRWLAVEALYPDVYLDFLAACGAKAGTFAGICEALGLDTARLEAWAAQSGPDRLAMHYRRSMRLGIRASPTLTRGNVPLDIDVSLPWLLREGCTFTDSAVPACDSLPECLEDSDCRRPGMVGRCAAVEGAARCTYRTAVTFTFTVVAGPGGPDRGEKAAVLTTRELFPGAQIRRLVYPERRARRLMEQTGATALPLYLFDTAASRAARFADVADGLEQRGPFLTFRDGVMPANYFAGRDEKPGERLLLLDPLLPAAGEILRTALATGVGVSVWPVIYTDPSSTDAVDSEDRLRLEEAQRWLLLARDHPEQYPDYLSAYAESPGSSYWNRALKRSGVDVDQFMAAVQNDSVSLMEAWRLLQDVGVHVPVAVLLDNRRLVRVETPAELVRVLAGQGDRVGEGE